jgi:stage III sporulation protein SpoIIIAA
MAFADPQSITINAIAKSLPRTSNGLDSGAFTKDDQEVKLSVSHAYAKRNRRTLRVDHQKITTDTLDPTINSLYTMSVYIVVDVPKVGYTIAEQKQVVDGFTAYLTASSGAKVTQLLGGEN